MEDLNKTMDNNQTINIYNLTTDYLSFKWTKYEDGKREKGIWIINNGNLPWNIETEQ